MPFVNAVRTYLRVLLHRYTGGEEVLSLSLLVLTMSFIIIQSGLRAPMGIAALAVQIGLLVRINVLHGAAVRRAEAGPESR